MPPKLEAQIALRMTAIKQQVLIIQNRMGFLEGPVLVVRAGLLNKKKEILPGKFFIRSLVNH